MPKQNAASAAPIVWPVSRAVATMPLALPERPGGALPIRAFMFGAWKKPKPAPQITIRQTILAMLGSGGNIASSAMPMPSINRPMPPSMPAG